MSPFNFSFNKSRRVTFVFSPSFKTQNNIVLTPPFPLPSSFSYKATKPIVLVSTAKAHVRFLKSNSNLKFCVFLPPFAAISNPSAPWFIFIWLVLILLLILLEEKQLPDTMLYLVPFWIAFLVGILVGWAWKPRWAELLTQKLSSVASKSLELSLPSSSSMSPMFCLKNFGSSSCLNSLNVQPEAWVTDNGEQGKTLSVSPSEYDNSSTSRSVVNEGCASAITEEDLKHLCQLVEMRDGGPTWLHMMDRSTPNMSYQAWRRDPKTGPPQYRSRTVFKNATARIVRDFFWDDEFRPKWDDMLAYSATIEECSTTGTMVVQWIRKFPFFCSDREYIIGRRIWEVDGSYYCVTKGVTCASVPRRSKPRRLDLYYSSWYIRAVESKRGNGQPTACEVLLFHHEDMGIPWEIAKLGVRQGMWGTVKKIEAGLCAYQKERESLASLSQSAYMAQVNTKISMEYLISLESNEDLSRSDVDSTSENSLAQNISRALIYGGLIVLACSLDHGALSKAFIFGMGRKLIGRGNRPS